jgi:hypothetical protein
MALFVPFATSAGTILGAACGLAMAVMVGYWDVITGGPSITFQWILPCSLLVNILAGCAFSLLLPTRSSQSFAAVKRKSAEPLVVEFKNKG